MNVEKTSDIKIGRYAAAIATDYSDDETLGTLADMAELLNGPDAVTLVAGRHQGIRIAITNRGRNVSLFVKAFGRQSALKDAIDMARGSKARRTWMLASQMTRLGVSTPAPVGFMDCWQGRRLVESYYLSVYEDELSSFKDELIHLYRESHNCTSLMALLGQIAQSVRNMHDMGILHRDLGNQNILMRRDGEGAWRDIQFIDLNRGRNVGRLSLRQRARDISRIALPSDFLRVFKEMYFGDICPPAEFQRWERRYRACYSLHSRTRKYRHPIRSLASREASGLSYPEPQDIWIWDEKSAQAISTMRPKERARHRKISDIFKMAGLSLKAFAPVRGIYSELVQSCFSHEVVMHDTIGITVDAARDSLDRRLSLLDELGTIPVMVRFHAHHEPDRLSDAVSLVRRLRESGRLVSVALVQDRNRVKYPDKWEQFIESTVDKVADIVERVEVGHAVNRVKWGVWCLDEHRRLLQVVANLKERHPGLKLMGPAAIDFEYPYLLAALDNVPPSIKFDALSHHLYVDRRGAPEGKQGQFSSLEKFALARAIARWSDRCEDRLIVSEVNWPLKGAGVHSPVTSPYESPGQRSNDPSVSEDDYADYMLRYLLLAICSGMVERVYWWRLVARGFGLVDDTDRSNWRRRPAFLMLKFFLAEVGGSTFVRHARLPVDETGVQLFFFRDKVGAECCIAYRPGPQIKVEMPFEIAIVRDAKGEPLCHSGRRVNVSGRPVYLSMVNG